MSLEGRTAVVTGGSMGIGLAIANMFAENGAKVFIFSRKPPAPETKSLGTWIECDIGDETAVPRALAAVPGDIHILVNNAAIAHYEPVVNEKGEAHSLENFKKVFQVNAVGSFQVLSLVAARMAKQEPVGSAHPSAAARAAAAGDKERGVIINISSVYAFDSEATQVAYAASKAAINGMTLPAARDLRHFGIRVVGLAPGGVDTPATQSFPKAVVDGFVAGVPFPHRLGHPDEIALMALQIVQNSYMNGEVVRVDGGFRMANF